MMEIKALPLTRAAFAPFGDVLDIAGDPDKIINQGLCGRYHDRAQLDFGPEGRAGISLFNAEARALPYTLDLVERHPDGSQAFLPMHQNEWLVIVAEAGETPGPIHAFVAAPGQGINFHRGTWHGVLTPLHAPGLFAVVDRIGDTANLEEHWLDTPVLITGP
ncbi:ureidoglycolate lyase [Tropicibacter naphthalenivorans]|uniref:Ureidoglycolate hydrolase n=1 Tax=Tropicibacter naphthalenivorans TaxID=441103 RepID=A0A0N7M190_9RHOB|nr:ureidoglycolate lyase [Tropicibacter naphthalenivorans]CUH82601.1 Ureidoglycolate hydrolase [Tropicibacter naphthalenivorans]SMD09577.1 ureidoglycolate lyase [Tropicibacter naphthalenivorans]